MLNHRIIFMSLWIVLGIALLVFPGFEMKGLALGMIMGCWPILISRHIFEISHHHPIVFLSMAWIVSGTTIGLLAWFLDRAQMRKSAWIWLGLAIIVGSAFLTVQGISYEDWTRSPEIAQAMASPEVNYEPNHWDYGREIVIPLVLAGGLWGLYGATGLCVLWSIVVMLKRYVSHSIHDRKNPA